MPAALQPVTLDDGCPECVPARGRGACREIPHKTDSIRRSAAMARTRRGDKGRTLSDLYYVRTLHSQLHVGANSRALSPHGANGDVAVGLSQRQAPIRVFTAGGGRRGGRPIPFRRSTKLQRCYTAPHESRRNRRSGCQAAAGSTRPLPPLVHRIRGGPLCGRKCSVSAKRKKTIADFRARNRKWRREARKLGEEP